MRQEGVDHANQHFVPKSYIRGWCDPTSPQQAYVWTASSEDGPILRESPKKLFSTSDFYTVVDEDGSRILELEHKLHEVEDGFVHVRDNVLARGKPLQAEDRRKIALFASTLYARTEFQHREQVELWQTALNELDELPLESSERLKQSGQYQAFASLRDQPMPFHLFNFVNIAAPFLLLANCAILQTEVVPGFITSDNPCIWMDGLVAERGFTPYPFGLGSPKLNVLLPITPRQAISLEPRGPEGYISVNQKSGWLDTFNQMTVMNSDQKIVMSRKLVKSEWFRPV